MNGYDLIQFYLALVACARERGIRCAITSGMACVAFEVAEATKDCDLLCDPDAAGDFLALLAETELEGARCCYRGRISPPLDARWHAGGWTSHFEWPGTEAYLDVFGIAPRARTSWLEELDFLPPYAHPHVVADMKRTGRDKDWPFISELGALLIEHGDPRGWLHLYETAVMQKLAATEAIPEEILRMRPVLGLALRKDPRLFAAVTAERIFWQRVSEAGQQHYQRPLRAYLSAVRRAEAGQTLTLTAQHAIRCACADAHLPRQPLGPTEFAQLCADASSETLGLIHPDLQEWLPDVTANYRLLIPALK